MSQDSLATPPPAPAEVVAPAPVAARPTWSIPAAALGAGVVIGAVATLALHGGEPEAATSVAPPRVERGIALPEALAQRAGIEVAPVVAEPVVPTIEIVGDVAFDPARIADVGGRLEGRVVDVHVELGDHVEPGDPLVSIEGPDLGQAIAELLEARAELAAASSQADRQATLRRDQLTTATALEQASAERAALEARVRGAEQHLAALGLAPGSITAASRGRALPRTITLRAPIAGEVVERQVHLGAVVDPTHPLVRIADLSAVWIVLNMFEHDLGRVREGDRVELVSESHPDDVLSGTVAHVGATVDEATRTADVRVVVDNADRRLRPGQFVHATLHVSGEAQHDALLLPQSAISQIAGQPGVFVRIGENRYDVRPLELGERYGTRVEVRRGLAAGDEVVVEGAFALKSELER
jgi:cobalt-zinc-cadmium efflux system membrane fusion protein